jgi:hypothetical protein
MSPALPGAAKTQEDEDKNEHQRHRHNQRQPCARLLQMLELPAEFIVVAGWKLHFCLNASAGLVHITFRIAPAQIHENRGSALAGFAGDRTDLFEHFKSRDLAEREQSALFGAHRHTFHLVNAPPGVFGQPHDDGEASVAFDERANFLPGKCGSDGPIHSLRLKVVTAQRLAVGFDLQQWRAAKGVELNVTSTGNLPEQVTHFSRQPFEFLEVIAEDLHRDVCSHRRPSFR